MTYDGDGGGAHRRPVTRRKAIALGAAVATLGCSEILEDDSNSTPTSAPTSTPEPLAETSIQEEALQHGEEHYYVDDIGRELGDVYKIERMVEHIEDFLDSEDYSQKFKDKQLEYWLDLPGNLDEPGTTVEEDGEIDFETVARDIKHYVLRNKLLGADDWTKTGQPHILPDGTDGEGHHYNHTEEPNWDPDAFMPRWYNETGRVFDIPESGETPGEWKYLGPEAAKGDRVGKLGEDPEYAGQENQANFSIANHLEEPEPEDLVGDPITVCRVDWTAQEPEDYSPEPSTETLEIAEDVLKDVGFQPYMFKRKELEYNEVENSTDLEPAWKQHMPTKLKGPVEYAVIGHGLGGGWSDPEAALGFSGGNTTQEQIANTILHECYGHPLIGPHADKDKETIMTPTSQPDPILQFTEDEEETLHRGIDIRSPSRRDSDAMYSGANPGFYSGPMAAYKSDEYYDAVRNHH